ncbi:hypothetical protein B9T15_10055 [Wohlfahrtiimonas chitiniclastica]|nr:hypothetical protein B9T14_10025 [Wohlfahrtiimonas chitiniclastica]OYQ83427.1 hypothetical protein B9T15_10055 [Wohlfahrtiimonas chitiniclastica]
MFCFFVNIILFLTFFLLLIMTYHNRNPKLSALTKNTEQLYLYSVKTPTPKNKGTITHDTKNKFLSSYA